MTVTTPQVRRGRLDAMRGVIARDGERMAAFMVELVQGEAGFRTAPREFFVPLFEQCRGAGIPVWVDEVQTFGRVIGVVCHRPARTRGVR